jgi:hypothetical protein
VFAIVVLETDKRSETKNVGIQEGAFYSTYYKLLRFQLIDVTIRLMKNNSCIGFGNGTLLKPYVLFFHIEGNITGFGGHF